MGWPSYLRRTPPRREALRHSGGESRRCTSPTVTLYLDVELSKDSRPGTEQKTSLGLLMPPTRLSLDSERVERLPALEGMGTVEQKQKKGGDIEPAATGQPSVSCGAGRSTHQQCVLLNDSNTFQRVGSIMPALQKEKLRHSVVEVTYLSKSMGVTLNPELSGSFSSPPVSPFWDQCWHHQRRRDSWGHCDRV